MVMVLDCSVTAAWLFEEEESLEYSDAMLDALKGGVACIPAHWFSEIANAIAMSERRKRHSEADRTRLLQMLEILPLDVDEASLERLDRILGLANEHRLTAYDAAYLELAMRKGLPLATLDKDLIRAAKRAGVALVKA